MQFQPERCLIEEQSVFEAYGSAQGVGKIAATDIVVLCQQIQTAGVELIDARVADVHDESRASRNDQRAESGRHAGARRVDARLRRDPTVDRLQGAGRRANDAQSFGLAVIAVDKGPDRRLRSRAPAFMAADAVRDGGDNSADRSGAHRPEADGDVILVFRPPALIGRKSRLHAKVVIMAGQHDSPRVI